jgi:predicted nucleic acid-binding protein
VGEVDVSDGAGDAAYVNEPGSVADPPSGFVTVMVTAPPGWAGASAVISVDESTTTDRAPRLVSPEPNSTVAPSTKPVPVIVTGVPPRDGPVAGGLEREAGMSREAVALAMKLLATAGQGWTEVPPTHRVRAQAMRLLRLHQLRAADALQLAAALVLAEHDPRTLPFVTRDTQLAAAAEREGFEVLGG